MQLATHFFYFLLFTFYFPPQAIAQNPTETDTLHTICVVSHGWHTGIVVEYKELPPDFRKQPEFPSNKHIEFGWGDRDFYKNPDFSLWITTKAALWPTESVLHVVGFDPAADLYFSASAIMTIDLTDTEIKAMLNYILNSFKLDSTGSFIPLGAGLYGNSRFFAGQEMYIFPKTCNVWTAACLKAAGFDITPLLYQRAPSLMNHLYEESGSNRHIRIIKSTP